MSVGIIAGNAASISIIELTLTPAQVNTVTAATQTFTVPGVKVGDVIIVTPTTQSAGATIGSSRVSADNTISVQYVNPTGGNVTPTAGTHYITVIRKEGVTGLGSVTT